LVTPKVELTHLSARLSQKKESLPD
jgi:hypothetical protein